VEAEQSVLVSSAATTVVGLMGTDRWGTAGPLVATLLRRGGRPERSAGGVESELEQERREVLTARDKGDATVIADLEAVWRTRLRRLLRQDPATEAALRGLIGESIS
jgi:hypothetical protein